VPDNLTVAQRSLAMSRIRSTDTQPELRLRRALWAAGLRGYRVHSAKLPGKPDIVWNRRRVAVFIDGAFWHGHPTVFRPGKSGSYWDLKIAGNRRRDRRVSRELRALGWTVLRVWDFQVERHPETCIARIVKILGSTETVPPQVGHVRHNDRRAMVGLSSGDKRERAKQVSR
jgi:DNA mismatch endonuclease (patch repair protein)